MRWRLTTHYSLLITHYSLLTTRSLSLAPRHTLPAAPSRCASARGASTRRACGDETPNRSKARAIVVRRNWPRAAARARRAAARGAPALPVRAICLRAAIARASSGRSPETSPSSHSLRARPAARPTAVTRSRQASMMAQPAASAIASVALREPQSAMMTSATKPRTASGASAARLRTSRASSSQAQMRTLIMRRSCHPQAPRAKLRGLQGEQRSILRAGHRACSWWGRLAMT